MSLQETDSISAKTCGGFKYLSQTIKTCHAGGIFSCSRTEPTIADRSLFDKDPSGMTFGQMKRRELIGMCSFRLPG